MPEDNFLPMRTTGLEDTKHVILNKEAAMAFGEDKIENIIGKTLWDTIRRKKWEK